MDRPGIKNCEYATELSFVQFAKGTPLSNGFVTIDLSGNTPRGLKARLDGNAR